MEVPLSKKLFISQKNYSSPNYTQTIPFSSPTQPLSFELLSEFSPEEESEEQSLPTSPQKQPPTINHQLLEHPRVIENQNVYISERQSHDVTEISIGGIRANIIKQQRPLREERKVFDANLMMKIHKTPKKFGKSTEIWNEMKKDETCKQKQRNRYLVKTQTKSRQTPKNSIQRHSCRNQDRELTEAQQIYQKYKKKIRKISFSRQEPSAEEQLIHKNKFRSTFDSQKLSCAIKNYINPQQNSKSVRFRTNRIKNSLVSTLNPEISQPSPVKNTSFMLHIKITMSSPLSEIRWIYERLRKGGRVVVKVQMPEWVWEVRRSLKEKKKLERVIGIVKKHWKSQIFAEDLNKQVVIIGDKNCGIWSKDRIYIGNYKDNGQMGYRNGKGIEWKQNSFIYYGQYTKNKKHGLGIMKSDGMLKCGYWSHNSPTTSCVHILHKTQQL